MLFLVERGNINKDVEIFNKINAVWRSHLDTICVNSNLEENCKTWYIRFEYSVYNPLITYSRESINKCENTYFIVSINDLELLYKELYVTNHDIDAWYTLLERQAKMRSYLSILIPTYNSKLF